MTTVAEPWAATDQHLAASVQKLADAVVASRSSPQDGLSTALRAFRQPEGLPALRDLLDRMQAAWSSRVAATLVPKKRAVLQEILETNGPDLLGVFQKGADENSHTDVLRWLLDPRTAPNIAPAALMNLVDRFTGSASWRLAMTEALSLGLVSVRREYVIGREWTGEGQRDRIDLVISGPNFVIAVENKIWAQEHSGQTTTYWRWLEPLKCLRAGVFLTPAGYSAACLSFLPMSYLDMIDCLLEAPSRLPEVPLAEGTVLAAYMRSVAQHVLKVELRSIARPEE